MRYNSLIWSASAKFEPFILHDDVTKWEHFPRYCPFVRGIHRSPVNSPHRGPVTLSFDVFFYLCLNKRLSIQSRHRWFESSSHSLWRQCAGYMITSGFMQLTKNSMTDTQCKYIINYSNIIQYVQDKWVQKYFQSWHICYYDPPRAQSNCVPVYVLSWITIFGHLLGDSPTIFTRDCVLECVMVWQMFHLLFCQFNSSFKVSL